MEMIFSRFGIGVQRRRRPFALGAPETISTPRLELRRCEPGDALALHALVQASFSELNAFLPWARTVPSVRHTRRWLRQVNRHFGTRRQYHYTMFAARNRQVVGCVGLWNNASGVEVGYWLGSAFTGQGLMTEAVRALVGVAFDDLQARRVEIRCRHDNPKSCAVARRAGLVQETLLENAGIDHHGRGYHTVVFVAARDQWSRFG